MGSDNLLHPLFHPAQNERNPCGWNNTQPKSTLDDPDCPEYHDGRMGLSRSRTILDSRPRREILSRLSKDPGNGRSQKHPRPTPQSEFKCLCRKMCEIHQGGVFIKDNSVWRKISPARDSRVCRALPSGAQPPGQGKWADIAFPTIRTKARRSHSMSRTARRVAQVLPQ